MLYASTAHHFTICVENSADILPYMLCCAALAHQHARHCTQTCFGVLQLLNRPGFVDMQEAEDVEMCGEGGSVF